MHSTKFFVKDMKEKPVTFCFLKLKAKEKANFSKIMEERVMNSQFKDLNS